MFIIYELSDVTNRNESTLRFQLLVHVYFGKALDLIKVI